VFVANYMNISATPYYLHYSGFTIQSRKLKKDQVGGPGQLTGTRYLGHCKSEITGSNPATCMSALNSVINAYPVNKPIQDERIEDER